MSREIEHKELPPTPIITPDQRRGHQRFSFKPESGDASMTGALISAAIGSAILLSVTLYPVISDRVFEKRVEDFCIPSTIIGPAQCYHNITPEGEK